MTISILDVYTTPIGAATPQTIAYTVPAGSDRVLMMVASHDVVSCTYGGLPLTKIPAPDLVSGLHVDLWYLVNPPVGAGNFVISFVDMWSNGPFIAITAGGVDQTTPFGAEVADGGAWETSPHSVTASITAGQRVLGVWGSNFNHTADSPDTLIATLYYDGKTRAIAMSDTDDAAVSFGTWGGQVGATLLGIPVYPASSGGGGGTDATAPGATVTGTGTVSGGSATGGGPATGTFTFDSCENNTHSGVLNNIAVNWTWLGGTVGAITTITNGSGTMTTSGMTVSGLPTGLGCGILRTADGTVVAYQEGTVA